MVGWRVAKAAGPVHVALQLGAPTSIECIRVEGASSVTYPTQAVVRLDFPARGGMPPVKVYYHDGPRSDDSLAYRIPGMESETILRPVNNFGGQRARVKARVEEEADRAVERLRVLVGLA